MPPVRVGVIGCSRMGHTTHIPAYENPESRLVAICDTDEDKLRKAVDKYGVQDRYREYKELLESAWSLACCYAA
jgi:predicted dehydrogenase